MDLHMRGRTNCPNPHKISYFKEQWHKILSLIPNYILPTYYLPIKHLSCFIFPSERYKKKGRENTGRNSDGRLEIVEIMAKRERWSERYFPSGLKQL
jgi:hypothetical protein